MSRCTFECKVSRNSSCSASVLVTVAIVEYISAKHSTNHYVHAYFRDNFDELPWQSTSQRFPLHKEHKNAERHTCSFGVFWGVFPNSPIILSSEIGWNKLRKHGEQLDDVSKTKITTMMTSRRSRAHEVPDAWAETLEEMASVFKHVALVPTAHVFHVTQSFNDDPSPNKVNLGVGGERKRNFFL